MNYRFVMAAIMAAFLLSGCGTVGQAARVVDRAEDAALTAFEIARQRANKTYDQLLIRHQENALKLQRLGRALGRIQ